MKLTELTMAPNITIYKGDYLKLVDGKVTPHFKKTCNFYCPDCQKKCDVFIGEGEDKLKIAAEFKQSGDKPTKIKVYDRKIIFNVQLNERSK
jgi:hypothetical protein